MEGDLVYFILQQYSITFTLSYRDVPVDEIMNWEVFAVIIHEWYWHQAASQNIPILLYLTHIVSFWQSASSFTTVPCILWFTKSK